METKTEQKPREPADTTPVALLDRIGAMERALADQGDRLRDHEKSLVERIADVDDDRRTTAAKLQRAWQSQHDEIDDRLRRQTWTLASVLVLLALAVGTALFLIYRQATLDRQPLARVPEELKAEPALIPPGVSMGDQPEDAVTETASSLARLEEAQRQALQEALAGERASREKGEARLTSELRRLATEQQGLAEAVESLRAPIAGEGAGGEEVGAQRASEIRSLATEQQRLAEALEALRQAQTPPAAPAAERAPQAAPEGEGAGAASVDPARSRESAYALQLIGFHSRDAMLKFAERADLPAQLYFREDSYRGRPWFALIHSLHDDYASAEAELSRLPADLARLDPWIRPIRDQANLKRLDQVAPR